MHGRYRGGDVYQVSIPLIYRHFLHAFMRVCKEEKKLCNRNTRFNSLIQQQNDSRLNTPYFRLIDPRRKTKTCSSAFTLVKPGLLNR